jgi:hypothetical protein
VLIVLFCLLVAQTLACRQREPEAERRAALKATLAQMRSCLPAPAPASNPQLAIASVTRREQETSVRLLVVAGGEAVDFHLPVYLMSRGRWLIDDKERAYLLDENCREYKLKDRKSVDGKPLPLDGKVALKAGQAFEVRLLFPPLSEHAQLGALVYGATVIPFSLLLETR